MKEAKNVKEQFFMTKICKNLAFARFSLFNASPSEKRSSARVLYNCLIIKLSLLNASLPAPFSKKSTPVLVKGRLLLKYY